MRLTKDNTALLAVDYQEKLMPAMHNRDAFIPRSCVLLEGLKTLNIQMLASEQYPKGLGSTVPEIREAMGIVPYLPKTTFSCMADSGLRAALEATGCKNILLIGAETHICVLQTALDLIDMGKSVMLVTDCIGSRFAKDMEIGVRRAEQEGVFLTTTEAVLFELLGKAGSSEFKRISALIK